VFDGRGTKLPDRDEAEIERLLDAQPGLGAEGAPDHPAADDHVGLHERYLAFLARCLEGAHFDRLTVVLDAAHGAASNLGPEAFRRAVRRSSRSATRRTDGISTAASARCTPK